MQKEKGGDGSEDQNQENEKWQAQGKEKRLLLTQATGKSVKTTKLYDEDEWQDDF